MSSIKTKLEEILALEWKEEERAQLEEMFKNVMFYKTFLSKNLERDIVNCINICIREKKSLDAIKKICSE